MNRFQFHLSTALALTTTAGLLIAANIFTPRNSEEFGWPVPVFRRDILATPTAYYWDSIGFAVFDGLTALLVLLWVGFIFEARHWGWPGGKIFVWAFLAAAVNLVILTCLQTLILGPS